MDLTAITGQISGLLWSKGLIYLCLGAGIFFSIRMKFPQVRLFKTMVKTLIRSESSDSGISSLQAFAMALGGRVGVGNIAGVATAIFNGGPGAVFWMWLIAFLGAGSAYIESALSQVWKEDINGEYVGGPAYYIEKGLKNKAFAVFFAVATIAACGICIPQPQAYTIAECMKDSFGIAPVITGLFTTGLLGIVIFGGVKRIARFAEMVVPFMAIAYCIIAIIIMIVNVTQIPTIFGLIIKSAFGLEPLYGGILGSTVLWGIKRGVYSNEAGQGSGPMASAATEVSHPAKQGLAQAFSVYVDTLFVCSATAFIILSTGMYNVKNPAGGFFREALPGVIDGPAYTSMSIDTLIPGFGGPFVALAVFFFAFTTLVTYAYYAQTNVVYLFKKSKNINLYIQISRSIMVASTLYGAIRTSTLTWNIGDIGVGTMAWLNIIAILLLTKPGVATLEDYEKQRKLGLDPVFDPETIGVKNSGIWHEIVKNKYAMQATSRKEKDKSYQAGI